MTGLVPRRAQPATPHRALRPVSCGHPRAAGRGGGAARATGQERGGAVDRSSSSAPSPIADRRAAASDGSVGSGLTVELEGTVLADDPACGSAVTVVPTLRSTLGPLANNGGPTRTHLPLPSSPAIGAVPTGQCTDWAGTPVTEDQRGQPRPFPTSGLCDAGAVELTT
ncbi:MAG: hypothetical protein NZ761_09405, partial [Dehalococcoidia bacterium]|nr:hypothetical protein [Dehalococcoidia bacterium]